MRSSRSDTSNRSLSWHALRIISSLWGEAAISLEPLWGG